MAMTLGDASNIAQVALAVLTLPTLWYLRKYTKETEKFRGLAQSQYDQSQRIFKISQDQFAVAQQQGEASQRQIAVAQEQTAATIKQTHIANQQLSLSWRQHEASYRPLVILTTQDNVLGVVNLGNGPAFRVKVSRISGNISEQGDLWVDFTDIGILLVGQPTPLGFDLIINSDTPVMEGRVGYLFNSIMNFSFGDEIYVNIEYGDMTGIRFITSSRILVEDDSFGRGKSFTSRFVNVRPAITEEE
jgi:hypothetical protein